MVQCPRRALPSSLLLLSRAFTVTAEVAGPPSEQHIEGLKETLGVLPNKVFHEISLEQHPAGYAHTRDGFRTLQS